MFKPDAGMLAKRWEYGVVLGVVGGLLHLVGHEVRVGVQVQAKAVAGFIVDRRDGGDDGIAAILALGPIYGVVLPVHAQIQAADGHGGELGLACPEELLALAMNEVDLAVEGIGADLGYLADAAKRHLVHQQLEDQLVLVALALPQRAGLGSRKGLAARVAPPTGRAGLGGSKRRVEGLARRYAEPMLVAGFHGDSLLPTG